MRDLVSALRPLALAAADLAVGGILYQRVSVVLGAVLAAIGVLVVGGALSRTMARERVVLVRLWERVRAVHASRNPVTRRTWTRL